MESLSVPYLHIEGKYGDTASGVHVIIMQRGKQWMNGGWWIAKASEARQESGLFVEEVGVGASAGAKTTTTSTALSDW